MGERRFKDLVVPVAFVSFLQVEGASRRAATRGLRRCAPDAIAHVGVGGVEDAGLGQVAKIGFVLLDLLVAAWQIQSHFRHVVNVAVSDVPNLQTSSLHLLPQTDEILQGRLVAASWNVDVPNAELPGELKIFIARVSGNLQRHLNSGSKLW